MREDDDGDTRYQIINGSAAGAEEEAAEEAAAVSRSLFLLFFSGMLDPFSLPSIQNKVASATILRCYRLPQIYFDELCPFVCFFRFPLSHP